MSSKGAGKGAEKGAVAAVAAVDRPESIRNMVVVGHSGSGKTTLVEALLAATGDDRPGGLGRRRHHGERLTTRPR